MRVPIRLVEVQAARILLIFLHPALPLLHVLLRTQLLESVHLAGRVRLIQLLLLFEATIPIFDLVDELTLGKVFENSTLQAIHLLLEVVHLGRQVWYHWLLASLIL